MALWGDTWGVTTPSGYASIQIPVFKYYSELITIGSTNNTLVFSEGGADLTATVASGAWSWGELAWKVKVALEAAGAGTYTVTYNHSTRKFTLTKSAGTFTLNYGGSANDILDDLGFTGDQSGALTYTSATAVPSQSTLTCTQKILGPQYEDVADREDTVVASGRRDSVYSGSIERYTFKLRYESVAIAQGFWDLWHGSAKYGKSFEFYPDSTDLTAYFEAYWDAKTFKPREMTAERLYRLYEIEIPLALKVPAGSSTIDSRDLLDRRPSS